MKKRRIAAGIDLGGTNTALAWVGEEGLVLQRDAFSTRSFLDPSLWVAECVARLRTMLSQIPHDEVLGIGIGAPNGNVYSGCIEHAPNLLWKGIVPLVALFTQQSGWKAALTNDANAAAVGEKKFGDAKDLRDFLFITLGTGVGSGVFCNGELVSGHDGFAGELGHVQIERGGRICGCGRLGCIEAYASAAGISQTYRELSNSEDLLSPKDLFGLAQNGNPYAKQTFEKLGSDLGYFLSNAVCFSSPKAIFLFGGVSAAGDLLLGPLKKAFEANLLPIYQNKIDIRFSALPENDAALLGAASLVF